MKKFLVGLAIVIVLAKPIIALADEVIPDTVITADETTLLSETEETYVLEFTEEEKQILLDSIQTIRAILVFIVFVIVFVGIIVFLSWFF